MKLWLFLLLWVILFKYVWLDVHTPDGNGHVTIPNGIKSIGNEAFGYCSALQSVTIPNSVESIGDSAFYGCSALQSVLYLIASRVLVVMHFNFAMNCSL